MHHSAGKEHERFRLCLLLFVLIEATGAEWDVVTHSNGFQISPEDGVCDGFVTPVAGFKFWLLDSLSDVIL